MSAELEAIRGRLPQALVAVDFDGTLAPVVSNPADARALPGTAAVLTAVARQVRRVAVITGRPSEEAVEFGNLAAVPGLVVLGHYGLERWEAGRLETPTEGGAIDVVRQSATELIAARPGVTLEDKVHSVALHTRNASEPAAALRELLPIVTRMAMENGMQVTPGRFVVEVRPAGVDKGVALRSLVHETGATAVLYVGDDTGDLPAVDAVRDLAAEGVVGVVVCSDAEEADPALRSAADIIVPGPEGVQELFRGLVTEGA